MATATSEEKESIATEDSKNEKNDTKMRAIVHVQYDDDMTKALQVKSDWPIPSPNENEVLIQVYSAALNPIDWKTAQGFASKVAKIELPRVIGHDISGIVVKLGAKVTTFAIGDRVCGMLDLTKKKGCIGSFCEYTVADVSRISKMPDDMSYDIGASLQLVGLTSYEILMMNGGIKNILDSNKSDESDKILNGMKILILGGSTATGMIAIQICKALNFGEISVTSSQEELCQSLGATKVFNYKKMKSKKNNSDNNNNSEKKEEKNEKSDKKEKEIDEHCWYEVLNGANYDIIYDCVGNNECYDLAQNVIKHKGGKYITLIPDNTVHELNIGSIFKTATNVASRKFGNIRGKTSDYQIYILKNTQSLDDFMKFVEKHNITMKLDEDSPFTFYDTSDSSFDSIFKMFNKSMQFKSHGKLVLRITKQNDNDNDKTKGKDNNTNHSTAKIDENKIEMVPETEEMPAESPHAQDNDNDGKIITTTTTTVIMTKNNNQKDEKRDSIVANDATRENMAKYWSEHSDNKEINASLMLLMKDNPEFEENERKEIVSYFPNNIENMDIIELGAGIGRFTSELCLLKCKSILAIDFVEKFILENEKINGEKYSNEPYNISMKFECKDVTKINDISYYYKYDFVFSNWLMMYLDDLECIKLMEKMYKWCKIGGYIFFRESCKGGASGDIPRTNNPTYYRDYEWYTNTFNNIATKVDNKMINEKNEKNWQCGKLVNISVNKVKIYIEEKNKTNQYCWLYQKLKYDNDNNDKNENENNGDSGNNNNNGAMDEKMDEKNGNDNKHKSDDAQ